MQMQIEQQFRKLMNFFIVLFVIISITMVYWQVDFPFTKAAAVANSDYNSRACLVENAPQRGRIFDRNGVLLAYSERDKNSPCGWRRRYKYPSLSPIIGYFSYIYGKTGLESYYDNILAGREDPSSFDDATTQFWNRTLHKPVVGTDVYLSIDVRVQDELDKVFLNQVGGNACPSSSTGSIIVENPLTGEILGMLSRPYFNADTIGDQTPVPGKDATVGEQYWKQINTDPSSPLIDRPIQGQYPPGSTFKTLTMAAAIDSGQYTTKSTFTKDEASTVTVNGVVINSNNLGDYTFGPVPPSFPLDLKHAYAYSDNVVFARVGVKLGADVWTDYARRFYMSTPGNRQTIPLDTADIPRNSVYSRDSMPPELLADSAFGQGELSLSPMTMSLISSTIAADGTLFEPRLAMGFAPQNTGDPATIAAAVHGNFSPTAHQVVSPQAAQAVRDAMRAVVEYGSVGASGGTIGAIRNSKYTIGGKTGSAQVGSGNAHAWFLAIAPDNTSSPAQLSVVVMKEHAGEGACQAPIAQQIIEFTMPLLG